MTRTIIAALAIVFALLFILAAGGIALLATIAGSMTVLISAPVLWLRGNGRRAAQILAVWGAYLALYVTISTVMAILPTRNAPHPRSIGEEVCADSGCFAIEKVDKASTGDDAAYTLFWRLASTSKQEARHFPGKGLELFMFDERGRTFRLPADANPNPLDVTLPAGETLHQSITFHVPADAHQLFLTAKYRPLTFQSSEGRRARARETAIAKSRAARRTTTRQHKSAVRQPIDTAFRRRLTTPSSLYGPR
jgi:hypothetical protein